jgi:hypothetical protein
MDGLESIKGCEACMSQLKELGIEHYKELRSDQLLMLSIVMEKYHKTHRWDNVNDKPTMDSLYSLFFPPSFITMRPQLMTYTTKCSRDCTHSEHTY